LVELNSIHLLTAAHWREDCDRAYPVPEFNVKSSPEPGLRCRRIEEADIEAVATFLTRGFPARNRRFWLMALAQLTRHATPPGWPKYGYLLESEGVVRGALLLIISTVPAGETTVTRCNLSSWYVEPAFRAYAPLLVAQATGRKDVTYLNISPAPHTRQTIEAQGFLRYCDGTFVAVPLLRGLLDAEDVEVFAAPRQPTVQFDPRDQQLLLDHAAFGCLSLWCATPDYASPFVFRPRIVRHCIPCAQLIYCRDRADLVRFAGPLGRALARRGRPFIIVDANAPVPGLPGWYRRVPKYYKGPQPPRLGDLAYTERAMFGV
jgi:hypothetical protein